MKLSNIIIASSALLSIAQAAPAIITRVHTAPTSTQWKTYTTNTVMKIETTVIKVTGTPPVTTTAVETVDNTDATNTPVAPTTSSTEQEQVPTTTPTEAAPTTSSTDFAPTTFLTLTSSSSTSTPTTSTSSTSTTDSSQTSDLSEFEQDILDEHNVKRALHNVQDLQWNNTLAEYAANYASSSFSCDNVQLVHSGGPYGENLAAGYSGGKSPVDAWYNEIDSYDFSNPGFSESTGHFTQLVWKSSSQVGCAKVTCDNAWKQYTICEYSNTRGNIIGTDSKTGKSYFAENVLEPSS